MDDKILGELLRELDSYDRLGFASRWDDSGVRAKGVNRKLSKRPAEYPYDKEVSYGHPNSYDRGSAIVGQLHGPLTPKDDSKFSLKLLDDENIEEIMGSPILLSRGANGHLGSSVPGVTGWANDPPKDWDEDIEEAPLTIDPSPPDTEEVPNFGAPDFRMQTDDDLENKLNRIWGLEDNDNFVDPISFGKPDFHVIAPDPWSVINTRLSSRGLYGLMPKESAWDRVSGMVKGKRRIS